MRRDYDDDCRREQPERPNPSRAARGDSDELLVGSTDPRDVFARDLDLPRGDARERVFVRAKTYELRGSETRTLATVGAFRVVPDTDLREQRGPRSGDLRHLRDLGLVRTVPHVIGRTRTALVTLTERGRGVLEDARRDRERDGSQTFYAGISKPRELTHDAHLYRAYSRASERLVARGARIRRVVLDDELKGAYQRFLQASNRGRRDGNGRPDRHAEEIAEWAAAHHLPMRDEHVQFPDVRVEYDERDGRPGIEDLEVLTPHYRGAHAAGKAGSGFTCYRAIGARLGGGSGSGHGGGRGFDPRIAEEFLG
ncbi:MAG: hypothetical protein ABI846_15860 [Rudaea sp.]